MDMTQFVQLFGSNVVDLNGKRYVSIEDIAALVNQQKLQVSFGPNTPPDPGAASFGPNTPPDPGAV